MKLTPLVLFLILILVVGCGATGPQGPQGSAVFTVLIADGGSVSADGGLMVVVGPPGQGLQGPQGDAGVSVTSTALSSGNATCVYGGSMFTSAAGVITYACNGAPGPQGSPGVVDYSKAVANGTALQTGSFNLSGTGAVGGNFTAGGTLSAGSVATTGGVTASGIISGNASGLTSIPSASLVGTLPSSVLPGNVALLDRNMTLGGATPTYRIGNVAAPVSGNDVATKAYVDTASSHPLGSRESPASSCYALHAANPSGPSEVYWVNAGGAVFQVYCDMATAGGGWTLVWSNLRGGRGKPVTELPWMAAINTAPRVGGALTANLESFTVYTGLALWSGLAPNGLLLDKWAPDYGLSIDQAVICPFSLNALSNYAISFSSCSQVVGSITPGLVSYSNGRPFSAYDADHSSSTCATAYTNTPWWYFSCWSGSINGGGESSSGFYNGAYWSGNTTSWGQPGGTGAGNGWIFIK